MTITPEEDRILTDPAYYHENGYPFDVWKKLRQEDPIHFVDIDGQDPYWAVTRYHDIAEIQNKPEIFENGPRLVMGRYPSEDDVQMVINMDPPQHRAYRNIAAKYFMPKGIEWVRRHTEEIVGETLDAAMERNGEVINLQEVLANPIPTSVISAYLGMPRERWGDVIHWTDQIINAEDPRVFAGSDPEATLYKAMNDMFAVYAEMFEERRKNPKEDLLTALLAARINGEPMEDRELYSWCFILTTAGHETTQSAYGLGVHELLKHPDQLARLRANPDMIGRAVEEILRFSAPAVHFCRTPNRDVELHGKTVRAGQPMVMFYPSANRDEEVFDNPDAFNIERQPNRHFAFGVGPHLCLGIHLARLELSVLFRQFLERVEEIEAVGEPERVYTTVTGGYRNFPVRMKVRPGKA